MNLVIVVGFSITSALLLYLLLKLFNITQHQAKQLKAAGVRLDSEKNELALLVTSAVGMDRKIERLEERLLDAEERLQDDHQQEQENSSYHSAIRRAQSGASFQKLVDECNISREEAELIIRLYGSVVPEQQNDEWPQ